MSWNSDEIRQLRHRLGWSQAELARRLNLDFATMTSIESGIANLPTELRSNMVRIFHEAEASAEQMIRRPIAEAMMRDRGLSQIHDLEIVNASPDLKTLDI